VLKIIDTRVGKPKNAVLVNSINLGVIFTGTIGPYEGLWFRTLVGVTNLKTPGASYSTIDGNLYVTDCEFREAELILR